MKTISLAIPVYNTSRYFLDTIKYALEDDFVSEIVVTDDGSVESEYNKLLSLIEGKDKIKVFRNPSNIGAFRNKYNSVKNCSNDWVYLLDGQLHRVLIVSLFALNRSSGQIFLNALFRAFYYSLVH